VVESEFLVKENERVIRILRVFKTGFHRHLKQLPKQSGEHLFEIIMRRYENRATIMTSNRPLEEWGKLVGDVPAATAILDRFLHHAEIIHITGKSYRLRDQVIRKGKTDEHTTG